MNKVCQNCRQPNPSEAVFCLNCAAPLARGQQPEQQWNQSDIGGQQGGQNFAPPASANGASQRATTALILAIAGFVLCCPLTSIPAVIVGWMEIDAIKKGQSPAAGMKFAQIGVLGGIAATILQAVGFIFWIMLSIAASTPYGY